MHRHVDSPGYQMPPVMSYDQWRDQQHHVQPTQVRRSGLITVHWWLREGGEGGFSKHGQEPLGDESSRWCTEVFTRLCSSFLS